MENSNFYVPTDIRFGKDRLDELPAVSDQFGRNVLLVYGGGSIKRSDLYQQITDLVQKNGHTLIGSSGVGPNPRVETVRKGIESRKENQIDVVLAVGDGSTIDYSKAIAAGFYSGEDIWIVIAARKGYTGPALPVVTILALAVTGSEMSVGAVIFSLETNQKLGSSDPNIIPRVSFLGPTNTLTVPRNQTAAGSADIFSHSIENYSNISAGANIQDSVSEGLMRTVIKNCLIALENPEDCDIHANLMQASSLTLNGLTGRGKQGVWSCHPMEHELNAFYDITHGIGLAILTPRWIDYVSSKQAVDKFAQFARNVWGVVKQEEEVATKKGIQALYDYFAAYGIPTTLPEVGIEADGFGEMAQQAVDHSTIAEKVYVPLDVADMVTICKDCLTESQFI